MIFADAFDFEAIFGGVSGSCLIYGIKRGLYSNEAGIGSAPNAAAAADVSHPVKQGLVQMLSVFIDTLLVCSATAFMGLFSGVPITKEAAGAAYVQGAASAVFGGFGPLLITVCMLLFGFSTLIGNLYYVDNCIRFIHKGLRLRASSIPSASSASPLSSSAPACPWLPFGLLRHPDGHHVLHQHSGLLYPQ